MSDKTLKKYLTKAEQRQLLAAIKAASGWIARRDYHAVMLMRSTGIRVGSLVQLTVADAQKALACGELALRNEISKKGCGYEVTLTREAEAALKGLLQIRREQRLGLDPDASLLPARVRNRGGEGMTTRAVQMRLEYWRQRAALAVPVTPHWLRHTLGQRMVRDSTAQNPLVAAARALGHRSLNSTAIYTAPTREEIRAAMQESAA